MAGCHRPRASIALAASLLAACAGGAEGVRLQQRRGLPASSDPYHFFMAHHKTGTALINHICDHMKKAVTGEDQCARCQHIINTTEEGTWCVKYWSNGTVKIKGSAFYPASTTFFGAVPLKEVLKKAGEKYLAVHVVRDPLTAFASSFIYDQKGVDHDGAGKKELEGLSTKDALRVKALDVKKLTQEILADHELAKGNPRVLEVRYEDFKSDYDGTVTKIFDFMTEGGHSDKTPLFVSMAARDDQQRWQPSRMKQNHVSDPEEEKRVIAAIRELCTEGDAAVADVLRPRSALGYGVECPGPNDA
eukprot:CAMPEP_0204567542 /NCGR_PEP_ID=MMETSP0661-20131031/36662_1 /ASSEMBLY_ACC=CAM_ASM_000606 /TAXON_ID=109239 /ORGANISM="Alexandrium margalefi, Strain AMGDE01CS-322" /LENGTH=303 /DNA_ID=CAMNT_0051575477 /DNA_START=59 /DNA_END=970 /DNA_ORIENTATION=-